MTEVPGWGVADRAPRSSMGEELDGLFRALAKRSRFPLAYLNDTYTDHAEWRRQARQWVMEALCYDPGPLNLRAQVVERVEEADHVRERIAFHSAPEVRIPAIMLMPKHVAPPYPAIVALHDMGGLMLWGKEKLIALPGDNPALVRHRQHNYEGESVAHRLVKRGYAVIAIDAFMFGERTAPPTGMSLAQLVAGRDAYSEQQVGEFMQGLRPRIELANRHLMMVGTTWPGLIAWDDMRTVDYLYTRPEIDHKRIGCFGLSLGGFRTNLLLSLDDRVQVGVSIGWMTTLASLIGYNVSGTVGYFTQIPGMYQMMDLPDFMALCIPRPLQVMLGWQDQLFQPSGMREAVQRIEAAYRKAGCPERFRAVMGDHPHEFNRTMQDQAFEWLDRWLK